MTDDEIAFRLDPRLRAAVEDLVAQGAYESIEAFMNEAVRLKFQVDRILVDGEPIGPDPMIAFFESPRGRALLRELLREARET